MIGNVSGAQRSVPVAPRAANFAASREGTSVSTTAADLCGIGIARRKLWRVVPRAVGIAHCETSGIIQSPALHFAHRGNDTGDRRVDVQRYRVGKIDDRTGDRIAIGTGRSTTKAAATPPRAPTIHDSRAHQCTRMDLTCSDSNDATGQCLHLHKFAIRITAKRAVVVSAPAFRATVDDRTRVIHTCRDRRHTRFEAEHRHRSN